MLAQPFANAVRMILVATVKFSMKIIIKANGASCFFNLHHSHCIFVGRPTYFAVRFIIDLRLVLPLDTANENRILGQSHFDLSTPGFAVGTPHAAAT